MVAVAVVCDDGEDKKIIFKCKKKSQRVFSNTGRSRKRLLLTIRPRARSRPSRLPAPSRRRDDTFGDDDGDGVAAAIVPDLLLSALALERRDF